MAASTQTQALAAVLGRQLERVRVRHQADLLAGGGWVELPDALGRKYPLAGRSWPWQWLVPATWQYRDRETGELRRRR